MILSWVKSNSLFKKGILFSFFSVINNGLNFALLFILSVVLSKSQFGSVNIYIIYTLVFSNLISLGTESFFSINFFKSDKDQLLLIFNSIILVTSIIFFLLLFVFLLINNQFLSKYFLGKDVLIFALVVCYFQFFQTITLEIFRLEEKILMYGSITVLWIILNLLLTLLFFRINGESFYSRVYAHIIAALISFLYVLQILYRKGYIVFRMPSWEVIKSTLKYGIPLLPHSSTTWLRSGLDRYFIGFFLSSGVLGIYSFAYNLSGVVLMVGTAFNSINSVFIFKSLNRNELSEKKSLMHQIKTMLIVYFGITFFGFVSSFYVVKFIMPKYSDASSILVPIFSAALFQCYYYLFVNYLLYYKQTKRLMYVTFSISLIHACISYFTSRYSIFYTSILNLVSNFLIFLFVFFLARPYLPLSFKPKVMIKIKPE